MGLSEQILDKISGAVAHGSQKTQLRIDGDDMCHWAEVGERCIQHYVKELDKEEDAVLELIRDTPLAYNWEKVKELHAASQKSCKSQDEEPADKAHD